MERSKFNFIAGKNKPLPINQSGPSRIAHTPPQRTVVQAPEIALQRKYMIAFDDINNLPDVWIDGKPVHGLVDISIDWHTKYDRPHINHFNLKHYQVCDEGDPVLNELRQPRR